MVKIKKEVDIKVPQFDKLVHFGIYFIFTLVWFAFFYNYSKSTAVVKNMLKAAIWALVFGVVVEVLQSVNPNARSGDPLDVLANSIGIIVAVLIIKYTKLIRLLKSSN
ncbi:VanZ family protein [Pseudofulvibacter geojedonensis]|uniref:VanZ family protein n=1 Tax=Pseudofulvibacter geojedonensis TaxID=1123758 RepID=UPI00366C797E